MITSKTKKSLYDMLQSPYCRSDFIRLKCTPGCLEIALSILMSISIFFGLLFLWFDFFVFQYGLVLYFYNFWQYLLSKETWNRDLLSARGSTQNCVFQYFLVLYFYDFTFLYFNMFWKLGFVVSQGRNSSTQNFRFKYETLKHKTFMRKKDILTALPLKFACC